MMKRILRLIIMFLVVLIACMTTKTQVEASVETTGVPYKTYTEFDNRLIETQTAFLPLAVLKNSDLLASPEDIYIDNDLIYVANTGKKNILVLNLNGDLVQTIGDKNIFDTPTGIYVKNGLLYVADRIKSKVFVFDINGNLIREYAKPKEALFGEDANFVPEKVVVDNRGNVYITGSGSTNGVIQLNSEGRFLGYFAVNTSSYSNLMFFSNWLDIGDLFAANRPPAPTNFAIDEKGLIYTVTQTESQQIKKFDFGSNIMLSLNPKRSEESVTDIAIDANNNIFVVTSKGTIYEFDQYGHLLFTFGGYDSGDQCLGLLANPTGITLDNAGNLYVLDKNYHNIQIYAKTNFNLLVDKAIKTYNDGDIQLAKELFLQITHTNEAFAVANEHLGKIYLKEGDYEQALAYFEVSQYKTGYSDAFWEIRNQWLINNISYFLIGVLVLVFLSIFCKIMHYDKVIKAKRLSLMKKLRQNKLVRELLLTFTMLRHPLNTFYDIQRRNASSYLSASIIYLSFFIVTIVSYFTTSFLFINMDVKHLNILLELGLTLGIPLLFVVSNYLMSTLSDGDGNFKALYIASAYCLTPVIIARLSIACLSNVLTYNELFIIQFINLIAYIYLVFLFFFMIKDIHNFSVGKTIKNILLTLFTMAILIILMFIVCVLVYQLFEFMIDVLKEVVIRASS